MEPLSYEVIYSLKRSKLRLMILTFLCSIYPNAAYPSYIAKTLGVSVENVIGALRGLGNRYRSDLSLVSLGLVEEIRGLKNVKLYRAKKEVCEALEKILGKKWSYCQF